MGKDGMAKDIIKMGILNFKLIMEMEKGMNMILMVN